MSIFKAGDLGLALYFSVTISYAFSQTITDRGQLKVEPDSANIGQALVASCSSNTLEPGKILSVQWDVIENGNNRTLGRCHSVRRGATQFHCSSSKINFTEPYQDGATPYAVTRLSFTSQVAPLTFYCLLDGTQQLQFSPELRVEPELTNIQVQCNTESLSPELHWTSPPGSSDYFEVNVGNGWERSDSNVFPFMLNATEYPAIQVRGVHHSYGTGEAFYLISSDTGITEGSYLANVVRHLDFQFVGCAKIRFATLNASGLTPVYLPLIVADGNIQIRSNATLQIGFNETIVHDIDVGQIPFLPPSNLQYLSVDPLWQCGDFDLIQHGAFHGVNTPPSNQKPEQLNVGCIIGDGEQFTVSLDWKHWLEENEVEHNFDELGYENNTPVYTIELSSGSDSERIDIPINHDIASEREFGEMRLFPQSAIISVRPGLTYELTIIPNFHPELFGECLNLSLRTRLQIGADTEVRQNDEDSVTLLFSQHYSSYSLRVLNKTDNHSVVFESQGQVTAPVVLFELDLNNTYTAIIIFNGTDVTPCRTEELQFSLTPIAFGSFVIEPAEASESSSFEITPTMVVSITGTSMTEASTVAHPSSQVTVHEIPTPPPTEKNAEQRSAWLPYLPYMVVAVEIFVLYPVAISCVVCICISVNKKRRQ